MSLRLFLVIYLAGSVFTLIAFKWAVNGEDSKVRGIKHPWFFWVMTALLWWAMWIGVAIAYVVNGKEEPK